MPSVIFKPNLSQEMDPTKIEGLGAKIGGQENNATGHGKFIDHLTEGISEVNEMHASADKMASSVTVGESGNLHEAMLALTQAELSFNLLVQVRNKGLEAYQEVMRMPV